MVKDWKKEEVERLASDIGKYGSVMITDLRGLPARELLYLRYNLKKDIRIIVAKKALIKRALKKRGMEELAKQVDGIPALMLSNEGPFVLSIIFNNQKVPTYIKPGQKAEKDVVIPSGPTSFAPGPILTELSQLGLKTRIEAGKIKIVNNKKVLENGQEADENTADILRKMDIKPVKIGLNIKSAFVDKKVFNHIHVDVGEYRQWFEKCFSQALGLAYNAGIVNDITIDLLLKKAHSEALALALNSNIHNKETLPISLAQAKAHASALTGV